MTSSDKTITPRWPALPYKGLDSYAAEDAPLFVGREREVVECANLLGQFSTRILMLHGTTGCGKSSFLQAGLIPVLQDDFIGFQFLRTAMGKPGKALLIRSTDRPLAKLAETIYELTQQDEPTTAACTQSFREVLPEHTDRTELLEKLGTDPVLMVEILRSVARSFPKTLVIIIDQAEEVLTLNPGVEGQAGREQFFRFLQLFSRTRCDLKLVVTLRTDFYGRFRDKLKREERWVDTFDPLGESEQITDPEPGSEKWIGSYLLELLSHEQLVRVIELPTSKKQIPFYGAPYDHYKFSYVGNLPKKIVLDIEHALQAGRLTGGILPLLQIICSRLYLNTNAKAAEGGTWEIDDDDYRQAGDVGEQFSDYLRQLLEGACVAYAREVEGAPQMTEQEISEEVRRWSKTLCRLLLVHADNSVTKQLCDARELRDIAVSKECKIDFDWAVNYLSADGIRVLWRTEIVNPEDAQKHVCYSLGHDSIAMALQRWQQMSEQPAEHVLTHDHVATHDKEVLVEDIISEVQKLSRISGRRLWLDAAMKVAQYYAKKYSITSEQVTHLAEKIYRSSSYRPDTAELQVLAGQPETYFPQVIKNGEGGPIVSPTTLDEAASKIEEEGGEIGMVAKTIKAKSMAAKA